MDVKRCRSSSKPSTVKKDTRMGGNLNRQKTVKEIYKKRILNKGDLIRQILEFDAKNK